MFLPQFKIVKDILILQGMSVDQSSTRWKIEVREVVLQGQRSDLYEKNICFSNT